MISSNKEENSDSPLTSCQPETLWQEKELKPEYSTEVYGQRQASPKWQVRKQEKTLERFVVTNEHNP